MDRSVEHCTSAHLRCRLELARSKMNHLHTFLSGFSEANRLAIVSEAYSKVNVNREDILLEENMNSAKRTVVLVTHEEKVISH